MMKLFFMMMDINHSDDYFWGENLSVWWKFITVMKIYYCVEYLTRWCKLITVIKVFTVMKFYRYDENLSPWGKFITGIKIYPCDEIWSLWWNVITVRESVTLNITKFITEIKNISLWWLIDLSICYCDEIDHFYNC